MNLILNLPETTNHSYATSHGHWYKTAKASAWDANALWMLKVLRPKPIEDNVQVKIAFYVKRDRDIDGGIKPILDILAKGNVYKNDKQVVQLIVSKLKDVKNPRAVIIIEKYKTLNEEGV